MANRHIARSIVLQTLFELDFRGLGTEAYEEVMLRNANEFAPEETDLSFMRSGLPQTSHTVKIFLRFAFSSSFRPLIRLFSLVHSTQCPVELRIVFPEFSKS